MHPSFRPPLMMLPAPQDCWQARFRDGNGTLQADPRIFPSGIKALAAAIHADGNKFGIYVDQGYRTCQDRPGTLDNEYKDAVTFAEWGVEWVPPPLPPPLPVFPDAALASISLWLPLAA